MRKAKPSKISTTALVLLLVSFSLLSTKDVYAYVDPGSGSYILQLIAAALLGGLFTIKVFWLKIKNFLITLFSRAKQNNNKGKHE